MFFELNLFLLKDVMFYLLNFFYKFFLIFITKNKISLVSIIFLLF